MALKRRALCGVGSQLEAVAMTPWWLGTKTLSGAKVHGVHRKGKATLNHSDRKDDKP